MFIVYLPHGRVWLQLAGYQPLWQTLHFATACSVLSTPSHSILKDQTAKLIKGEAPCALFFNVRMQCWLFGSDTRQGHFTGVLASVLKVVTQRMVMYL